MGVQRIYTRATPYPATKLGGLDYSQTSDMLYSAHIGYPLQKLERYGNTDWRWAAVEFGPDIDPPVGASAAATTPNTTDIHYENYTYAVTAISDGSDGPVQESRRSSAITVSNDLSLAGNYNTITLPALPAGTERYVIYKKQGGVYGYIGNTDETTFKDNNIIPTLAITPLKGFNPFSGSAKYPAAVSLHQQRLVAGATRSVINGTWMSRSGDLENMDKSSPVRDDDSLAFALLADRVNNITHYLSMRKELLVFSGDAIWAISGAGENSAITASSIFPQRHSGQGAARIKPLLVDDTGFYVEFSAKTLRSIGFSFENEGYRGENMSIFAPHLFDDAEIKRIAYQGEPYSCIWTLLIDGTLLAFTWQREHEVWGWSKMDIDGTVQDIAVASEGGVDRLYAIIDRTVGEETHRNLERMALPFRGDVADACHLDNSLTLAFEEATAEIGGLWHLEGQTVSAFYDGFVEHDLLVENGTVTVTEPTMQVSVGLRYSAVLETLPAALTGGDGSAHTNRQQIDEIVVRTTHTRGIEVGISGIAELEQVATDLDGELSDLSIPEEADYRITVPGDWKDTSTVIIEQNEPLPCNIVGLFVGMNVNDR